MMTIQQFIQLVGKASKQARTAIIVAMYPSYQLTVSGLQWEETTALMSQANQKQLNSDLKPPENT